MNLSIRRIAVLTGLTLFPIAAFAAATGADGGLCASVCGWIAGCGCAG